MKSFFVKIRCMIWPWFIVLLGIEIGTCYVDADLALVSDGSPRSVIVIPENAGFVCNKAARELQHYLHEISGAHIPIYVENEFAYPDDFAWLMGRSGIVISIGQTQFARDAGLTAADLPEEGYLIESKGNKLFILGRDDSMQTRSIRSTRWQSLNWPVERRGTLYGVYAFLENHLGVRWLWPGELGEVVPLQDDIILSNISHRSSPAFAIRKFHPGLMSGSFKQTAAEAGYTPEAMLNRVIETDRWAERMRLGQFSVIDQTHFYGQAFWDRYHQNHPEWFALQSDGKRIRKPQLPDRVRICYSNESLQAEVARNVVDILDTNPDIDSVGIGLDDVSPETFCQCEPCMVFGKTLSDRVARYNSSIAKRVAEVHPDKYVTMFAYAAWREPPQFTELHPNVVVSYVGVYTNGYLYEPDRKANRDLWRRWQDRVSSKMVWRPNLPESMGLPVLWVHDAADDLAVVTPNIRGLDVDSMHGSWATEGLNHYVLARLMWDPKQDIEAIIEDYCVAGFGYAAPAVKQYFDLMRQNTVIMARNSPGHGYAEFVRFAPTVLDQNRLENMQSVLDEAAQLASQDSDPRVADRVAFLQEGFDWAEISLEGWKYYATGDTSEKARKALEHMYVWLDEHPESWAVFAIRMRNKMSWMWRNHFEGTETGDWSRPF